MHLTKKENLFISQSKLFLEKALIDFNLSNIDELTAEIESESIPLEPVIINNYKSLSTSEINHLKKNFATNNGITYFYVKNNVNINSEKHPIIVISEQLKSELQLQNPISYPYDYDRDTISKFGKPDGTTKIYESSTKLDSLALTSKTMSPHQDGMGMGGLISRVAFYCDSPPLIGGITFFQNIIKVGLHLYKSDEEAFYSLFLPNAISFTRKNKRKGIKITGPIFYLNEQGQPTFNLKCKDALHNVEYRNFQPLFRAIEFLHRYSKPFSNGSQFIQFTNEGLGCIVDNLQNIHGRTSFINDAEKDKIRVLSRKWFCRNVSINKYQYFPGLYIQKKYADLYPEYFGQKYLSGEWQYNKVLDKNEPVD